MTDWRLCQVSPRRLLASALALLCLLGQHPQAQSQHISGPRYPFPIENAGQSLPEADDNLPQTRLKHADVWLASKTKAFERRVAQLKRAMALYRLEQWSASAKAFDLVSPRIANQTGSLYFGAHAHFEAKNYRKAVMCAGYSRDIHGHIGALIAASSWLNATRRLGRRRSIKLLRSIIEHA